MDDEDNPGFVSHAECIERVTRIGGEIKSNFKGLQEKTSRIDVALWGSEGRNGIVGDVNLLLQRSKWSDRIMAVVIGIVASVLASAMTAFVIRTVLSG